jgi:hypothetical protein
MSSNLNIPVDPNAYLSLMYLAKSRPEIFNDERIYFLLVSFLSNDINSSQTSTTLITKKQPLAEV